ncbi:hypothetical protein CF326_g6598 [Tilletia indica]|nr:hypothetical protein CF326_g6598 [Tilletia indica]
MAWQHRARQARSDGFRQVRNGTRTLVHEQDNGSGRDQGSGVAGSAPLGGVGGGGRRVAADTDPPDRDPPPPPPPPPSPPHFDAQFDGQEDEDMVDLSGAETECIEAPVWVNLLGILVMWLCCAKSMSRRSGQIILRFISDVVLRDQDSVGPPKSIRTLRNQLGMRHHLRRYLICPKDDCQETHLEEDEPRSTHCSRCEEPLLHNDRPRAVYHHHPLISYIRECFLQPQFEQDINAWRDRTDPGTDLNDLYDGSAWNEDEFLERRVNLNLALGLDWFTPYHSSNTASYTIGVLSIRIDNLPPLKRYRPEHMHVVAILPGPRQTSTNGLEAAFRPLIEELRQLYDGVLMEVHGYPIQRLVRARLTMVLGDTPARAKMAGFPSHSQNDQWCGWCTADAKTWVASFLRNEDEEARDPVSHRAAAFSARDNPHLRPGILRADAACWTPLYDLPYWRSVDMAPVDAMHAVHLGACKRFFYSTLIEGQLLGSDTQRNAAGVISDVLGSATYPRGMTGVRHNFGTTSAGSPTADVWSTVARFLLPVLLASHWATTLRLDGSLTFTTANRNLPGTANGGRFSCQVLARHLLRMAIDLSHIAHVIQSHSISQATLTALEKSIRDHIFFMATYIHPNWMVPNHHALLHLPAHIRRFGPPRGFWFYSMERLNGFLKQTASNNHKHGQLETTMHMKHIFYRTVRTSITALGETEDEKTFIELLDIKSVRLDPQDSREEDRSQRTHVVGPGTHTRVNPATVHAIAGIINRSRQPEDPTAVPELAHSDGSLRNTTRTVIGASAVEYKEVSVGGQVVSSGDGRRNAAKGGANVIVRAEGGIHAGEFVRAFSHRHENVRTSVISTRLFAEVRVFPMAEWPRQHLLATHSHRLGYILARRSGMSSHIVPLHALVDTYVSTTARHITGSDEDIIAARLHPFDLE